ncbi:hypothetical protein [Nitrosomonas communis]|uniref:Uncharacterized protein n=1 Tax=Nitrosomonas communis TaxID=44574 RepID=A0A1I4VBX1_9PROT|nr:hypothetical protein [Nitrosomonas communis]SFM98667.1 hypothetical protein SAMN05421863_107910 [Nitrosomonas communis]
MHLHKFAGLDLAYVYQVLEAYGELWIEKTQLLWDEIWQHLLGFCEIIIKQESSGLQRTRRREIILWQTGIG